MTEPIRVGLIRCDTHGMWFGAQMDEHDPLILREPMPVSEEMRYSWQRAGVHYFYYTYYCDPMRMTAWKVDGFRIDKVWDEDRRSAEMFSRVFNGRPVVCDSFEQVSDDVDLVFIADCNGDGSDHLELATPGLLKKVPTFVDKPFAHNVADMRALQRLAAENDVPLLSLSILQTNPAMTRFARRLDEIGNVSFGTVTCANTHPAALIHAISIVHGVFGTGIETVSCLQAPKHIAFHLSYGERDDRPAHGVVINCHVAPFRFTDMYTCAYGAEGAIQARVLSDFDASEGSALILERVRDMVRTRQPDPLGDEMAEAIMVMEAAKRAEESSRSVNVRNDFG